jgi:hypothetical protein
MNYAVVILAFVLLVSYGYWFAQGKYYYSGPRTRAHIVNGVVIEDELAKLQDQENSSPPFVHKDSE